MAAHVQNPACRRILRSFLATVVLVGALTGCTGPRAATNSSAVPAATASTATATSAPAVGSSLIGEWHRTTTCPQRLVALRQAGLVRWAAQSVAGEEWLPSVTKPSQVDPARPCSGAAPAEHTHFFTAAGAFGSRDSTGQQVDDGSYSVVDAHTIQIDETRFRFTVDGDTLRLYPRLPACKATGCFPALWAVAVSYNGLPWQRTR
jgi:hypothetical protein